MDLLLMMLVLLIIKVREDCRRTKGFSFSRVSFRFFFLFILDDSTLTQARESVTKNSLCVLSHCYFLTFREKPHEHWCQAENTEKEFEGRKSKAFNKIMRNMILRVVYCTVDRSGSANEKSGQYNFLLCDKRTELIDIFIAHTDE